MAILHPFKDSVVYDNLQKHGHAEETMIKRIEQLDKELTKDWEFYYSYAFKSKKIDNRQSIKDCEIDFLCLLPNLGIFVLEVKGGIISKDGEKYYTTNSDGEINELRESPYYQARSNLYRLSDNLGKNKTGKLLSEYRHAYLVAFPDTREIKFTDPLGTKYNTYYSDKDLYSFLIECAKEEVNLNKKIPTKMDIDIIKKQLEGKSFVSKYEIRDYIDTLNVRLTELTEEQYVTFKGIIRNKRCLIEGKAGTGKTVLAEMLFKQEIINHENAAYFSYNVLNSNKVKQQIDLDNNSICEPIYDYLRKLYIEYTHKSIEYVNSDNLDEVCTEILNHVDDERFKSFTVLIIDEAQDLPASDSFLLLLNEMIVGGLKDGKCYIFYDSFQNIYKTSRPLYLADEFGDSSYRYAKFSLEKNCRNDIHINQTLDAIRKTKKTKIDESIELKKYLKEIKATEEDLVDKIKKELDAISKSIDSSSITILFDRNDVRKKTVDALVKRGVKINEYSVNSTKNMTHYTLQGFKGLENDCIFYVKSFNSIMNDYVSISRARGICYVFNLTK